MRNGLIIAKMSPMNQTYKDTAGTATAREARTRLRVARKNPVLSKLQNWTVQRARATYRPGKADV